MVVTLLTAAALLMGCGAFSRVVYVSDGQAVKLRAPIKGARVWIKTENGMEPGVTDLNEGWYCLSDTEEHNGE